MKFQMIIYKAKQVLSIYNMYYMKVLKKILMIINQKEKTSSDGQARGAAGNVAVNCFRKTVQHPGFVVMKTSSLQTLRLITANGYLSTVISKRNFRFFLPPPLLVFGLVFTIRLFTLSICSVCFYDIYYSPTK